MKSTQTSFEGLFLLSIIFCGVLCAMEDKDGCMNPRKSRRPEGVPSVSLPQKGKHVLAIVDFEMMSPVAQALHAAAARNDAGEVERILDTHAVIDVRDNAGRTPLHVAVVGKNYDVIEVLVRRGADRRVADFYANYYYVELNDPKLKEVLEQLDYRPRPARTPVPLHNSSLSENATHQPEQLAPWLEIRANILAKLNGNFDSSAVQ